MSHDDERPSTPDSAAFDALLRSVARAEPKEPPAKDELIGVTLGHYAIMKELGRGGMGVVYGAQDSRLARLVALKVLPSAVAADDDRRRRFLREARAAAAINHPNIATVYEVGEAEGRLYFAMELVEGKTLRACLGGGPLSSSEATRIARQIALGLARAHEKGVVHRDLKPENVMLTGDGGVKILDFGLAKLRDPTSAGGARSPGSTLTQEGHVMGTPGYMSPEQATGRRVDERTDVYALGIVLHEMITGELPGAHGSGRVAADAGLATIVTRCLARAPEQRWGNGGEVVAALDALAEGRTVPSRVGWSRPRSRARIRWAIAGGAIAIAAGVVLGGGAMLRHRASVPSVSPSRAENASLAPDACSSNRACVEAHGGGAWRCHAGRHVCVELGSEDCKVHAEPGDLERDDTVWFGGMYPLTEADFASEVAAVDLARDDFARATGAASALADGSHPRPIATVICDDGADPLRAARHLADDVEVPAVLGFSRGTAARRALSAVFLPARVVSFVTISQVTDLTTIPGPPGEPRLVWRSTLRGATMAEPIAALVSGVIEARRRAAGRAGPMRVAVLRSAVTSDDYTTALFEALHFNGKSALENGDDFRQYVMDAGADAASASAVVSALVDFAPDVVIPQIEGFESLVLAPLERQWRRGPPPYYLYSSDFSAETIAFAGTDAERRHRFFGVTNFSTTMTNAQLVLHYNVAHPGAQVTRTDAPQPSYDAFYALAYALYALGDSRVDGPALSRAIDRLLPPGKKVDVGPAGIVDAFETLRAGGRIDLNGAIGSLDFDRATGEAPIDYAILCLGLSDRGAASAAVESGLVYAAKKRVLTGTLRCR